MLLALAGHSPGAQPDSEQAVNSGGGWATSAGGLDSFNYVGEIYQEDTLPTGVTGSDPLDFTLSNGAVEENKPAGTVVGSFSVEGGGGAGGAGGGSALVIDPSQVGKLKWEFETGSAVDSSPAIGSDGTVVGGSRDKKVYAINGKTGFKLWEFQTGDEVRSSPAIGSDGTVYVGSVDKKLYAINGKSGAKLWEFKTGGDVYSSPAIGSGGTVYVGSDDKKLYAINGKTGVKLWEFETGRAGVFSSPAIGSDGTVYVGSDDKKLYAIKTDSKGLAKSPWPMRGQNARHTGRVMKKEHATD